jgi:uncharacterized protein
MKLHADRLTPVPAKLSFSGSEAWWRQRASEAALTAEPVGPFRFGMMGHTMGEDLYLEGQAEAEFEVECSRCVARYRHTLCEAFRLVLEPAGERVPLDPEGADALNREGVCLSDDLELGWYRGNEIDLESYLAEIVALAMPVQPLCRDECAGLCPACGANRNEADCGCSELKPNSPFAVLASLRAGQSGGKL